jgi:beta-lactam-binding protein with PASTA domain
MRFRRGPAPQPTRISQADTVVQDRPAGQVVEEEEVGPPPPPRRPPFEPIWPWLLLLLLLVIGGLVAAWLLTRDNDKHHGATVVVPNVVGQSQTQAMAQLNQRHLAARISSKTSKLPAGTVFDQDPSAGTHVTQASVVTLAVSAAQQVVVPDVVGKKAAAAVGVLRGRGLAVQTATVTSSKQNGLVLSQSPTAGASVAKGSTVVIRVSRGLVSVPNVVGQSRSTAEAAIRGAKLVPSLFRVPSSQPKGTVVAQAPPAGKKVAQGSEVRLNLSRGAGGGGAPPPPPPPPPAQSKTVPNLTGLNQAAAQRQLNASGFKAYVVYSTSNRPPGTVLGQSPVAGAKAPAGTRVKLSASLGQNPSVQQVPSVAGLSPQQARSRLQGAGFTVQQLTQKVSTSRQNGVVVDEQPFARQAVPSGTTVTIYVGRLS